MRILLIEEDLKPAEFHRRALREEGHVVDICRDGEDGAHCALNANYDAIILEVEPPGLQGFRILRQLRERKKETAVIMLRAQDAVKGCLRDSEHDAPEVLIKPFTCDELLTRLRALLRRGKGSTPTQLRCSDVTLSLQSHLVFRGSREIHLTLKEFALLEYFLRNPNAVLTRGVIAEHVWGYPILEEFKSNVLDFFVNSLRRKIEEGVQSRLIHTIRGVGYVLKEVRKGVG